MLALVASACAEDQGETSLHARLVDEASIPILEFEPRKITWLDDSTVVLVDPTNTRLVIHSLGDAVQDVLGSEGDGPGEFRLPVGVAVDENDGSLIAVDARQMRATRWDRSGAITGTVVLPAQPLAIHSSSEGDAVVVAAGFGADGAIMAVLDLDAGVVERDTSLFRVAPLLAEPGVAPGPPSPFLASASCGDGTFAIGNGWNYRIARVSVTGELVGMFGRPDLPPEMPTEADLARYDEGLRRATQNASAERASLITDAINQMRERPKPYFGANSFGGDDSGRLFVTTFRGTGAGTIVDVFDCDGTYVGEMTLRDQVVAFDARGDRLAVVVVRSDDEFERQGLDIYELE